MTVWEACIWLFHLCVFLYICILCLLWGYSSWGSEFIFLWVWNARHPVLQYQRQNLGLGKKEEEGFREANIWVGPQEWIEGLQQGKSRWEDKEKHPTWRRPMDRPTEAGERSERRLSFTMEIKQTTCFLPVMQLYSLQLCKVVTQPPLAPPFGNCKHHSSLYPMTRGSWRTGVMSYKSFQHPCSFIQPGTQLTALPIWDCSSEWESTTFSGQL